MRGWGQEGEATFWLCREMQIGQSYCSLGRRWEDRLDYTSGSVRHMLCPCGSGHRVSPDPSKGNWRSGSCPESIHATPHSVSGAAFSWVLVEPPTPGDGQSRSHAPSLCQMVLQTWSPPDGASALRMCLGASLPWHDTLWYVGTPLCVPQLLSQPPDTRGLHVPARFHHCAAITNTSQTPPPLFSTLSVLETLAPGRQLFSTLLPCSPAGWHLLALGWEGGVGQGEMGAGDQGEG